MEQPSIGHADGGGTENSLPAAANFATPGPTRFPGVDRREGLSLREFKRDYRNRRPVVVTDCTRNWKALQNWTFMNLKARYGDAIVHVYGYRDGKYAREQNRDMRLADYIDEILKKDFHVFPFYLRDNYSLFVEHRELRSDFSMPEYCFDWFKALPSAVVRPGPRIFIGPKGAMSNLHLDMWGTHFWMAQVEGRKRWILFPPDQRQFLYEIPGDKTLGVNFRVRPENADFDRFPMFRKATGLECIIGPGDTIIVPRDWAHWVISLDPAVSLTHNYMGPGNFGSCLAGQFRWTLSATRSKMSH